MIVSIKRLQTRIAIIHQIPKKFFKNLETSTSFGDHLFPNWIYLFDATDLKKKFKIVYEEYKALKSIPQREKIINTFYYSNNIYELCRNNPNNLVIPLSELCNSKMRTAIASLFSYLYDSGLTYSKFEEFVKDTKREALKRFRIENKITICPYCGLEAIDIIEGQFTPALDHWLPKAIFPMCAVNFNNLVPIGEACNRRPVKGDRIVLFKNFKDGERNVAFHPYINHHGTTTKFEFLKEPHSMEISNEDWKFSIEVNNPNDLDIFKSWNSIFNIETRYNDYFVSTIFPMWIGLYNDFLKDEDLVHANNIDELKENLKKFKSTFQVKQRPGSILYRNFIDYLTIQASPSYLYGIGKTLNEEFMPEFIIN